MPIYKAEPKEPTPEGDEIRTLLSEVLVNLAILEDKLNRMGERG